MRHGRKRPEYPANENAVGFGKFLDEAHLRLQKARREPVSAADIARWLDVPASTYSNWITKRAEPSREALERLCDLYWRVVSPEELRASYDAHFKPKRIWPGILRHHLEDEPDKEVALERLYWEIIQGYEFGDLIETCKRAEEAWQLSRVFVPHRPIAYTLAAASARLASQTGDDFKAVAIFNDASGLEVVKKDRQVQVSIAQGRAIYQNRALRATGLQVLRLHDEGFRMVKEFSGDSQPERTKQWKWTWNWGQRYRVIGLTDTFCGPKTRSYLESIRSEFDSSAASTDDRAFAFANELALTRFEAYANPQKALSMIEELKRTGHGLSDESFLARSRIVALFNDNERVTAEDEANFWMLKMKTEKAKYKQHLFETLRNQMRLANGKGLERLAS